MPSVSKKQHNLMAAVANNPAFAKKAGIPQSVGKEFLKADKGRSFSTNAKVNNPNTNHGKFDLYKKEGGTVKESKAMVKKEVAFMKKAGAPKSMLKHEKAEMKGMKAGGAVTKSKAQLNKDRYDMGVAATYKGGGSAYRRAADGVAQRGKTKGKMLRKGGMC
jgi:hypothetical protein